MSFLTQQREMSPRLRALIERAKNHVMTPEERIGQRRSWVRGEMMLAHPEMTEAQVDQLMDAVLPEYRNPTPTTPNARDEG